MKFLHHYLRFVIFIGVTVVATTVLTIWLPFDRALLVGFDIGAFAFIVALWWTLRESTSASMRQRAAATEPSQAAVSAIAALVVVIIIVALVVELGAGALAGGALAITAVTLLFAWLVGNILFALHYAHAFYLENDDGKDRGGLLFPEESEPVYWDFAYFAFAVGTTFGATDVKITSSAIRRVALLHGLIAFLYNVAVAALTVSLVGDALK